MPSDRTKEQSFLAARLAARRAAETHKLIGGFLGHADLDTRGERSRPLARRAVGELRAFRPARRRRDRRLLAAELRGVGGPFSARSRAASFVAAVLATSMPSGTSTTGPGHVWTSTATCRAGPSPRAFPGGPAGGCGGPWRRRSAWRRCRCCSSAGCSRSWLRAACSRSAAATADRLPEPRRGLSAGAARRHRADRSRPPGGSRDPGAARPPEAIRGLRARPCRTRRPTG